jgi:hypothetical protein
LIQSYKFLFGSSSEPHASTTPSESQ